MREEKLLMATDKICLELDKKLILYIDKYCKKYNLSRSDVISAFINEFKSFLKQEVKNEIDKKFELKDYSFYA